MMKKTLLLGLISAIFLTLLLIINIQKPIKELNNEAIKFKKEYEALNNLLDNNGKIIYPKVKIDDNNRIKYANFDEIMSLLNNGTGIIYFGRPNCPWSRNAVPVLLEAAKEQNFDKIYYFNAETIRDEKHLDENGQIVVDKEGTEQYYTLINKLNTILKPYEGLKDESIKRLYFPTIVFLRNGKIMAYHTGTVESQQNPKILLDKNQRSELKKIYIEDMKKISNIACDLSNPGCQK